MEDEHADETHHLLHGKVRMVEERAVLPGGELVDVAAAGGNRVHAQADGAIDLHGNFEAVPVDAGHLRQLIFDNNPEAVPFAGLDQGAGDRAVKAPGVQDAARADRGADHFGDEGKLLDAIDEFVRELGQVRGLHRNGDRGREAATDGAAAEANRRPKKPRRSTGIDSPGGFAG
jgi:hypothetical protein